MSKNFPKKMYVTRIVDDEDHADVDYFVDEDVQNVAERDGEDTEVAVYELVKIGRVKKSFKIVFE